MQFNCQICGENALEIVEAYSKLPRVTSDCKPWPAGGKMTVCRTCGAIQKVPDQKWIEDINAIYAGYQIYDLSSGAEQVIFNSSGVSAPRSQTLVDFILKNVPIRDGGKLIDIGCGNGAALGTFSRALPHWKLYGSELSDSALPLLKRLPNFVELYTVEPNQIDDRFDVVTMIHSLEHMPDPGQTLRDAAKLLAPGGSLFVEVPDVETSPFDLIVADHLVHFSRDALGNLAARAGLSINVLRNDVLTKEITFLGTVGQPHASLRKSFDAVSLLKRNVDWLGAVVAAATEAASEGVPFGIFGTSISGMWLYGQLKDKVAFFVDEDVTRVNQTVEGRPIVSPQNVPAGAKVFVPLIPVVADKVIARLCPSQWQFVAPPPIGA